MKAAPYPENETNRRRTLDALRVLDTLPESFSDAVSVAAAAIAQVPISAISLVDSERQWFKASCGLHVQQTSRDASFCAHAILGSEPLLVVDALLDPRFRDNPLVTGKPFIRAYAGFPLVVDGFALGALCVIDDRPRHFEDEVVAQLMKLAAGTSAWLSDRRREGEVLERTQQQLRHVTFNDRVTGLPGRMTLDDRVLQSAARCDRTRQTLAVLFVRLSDRRLRDHALSQVLTAEALREVARRLTAVVRASDTVARIGDGDFVILAEGKGSIDAALRIAEEIQATLGRPLISGRGETHLYASIGAALYPGDGPGEQLVEHAAVAVSGQSVRTGCSFFSKQQGDDAQSRSDLIAGLRQAIDRRELSLHYQPKVEASSGEVSGVEALLRWRNERLGNISPALFIPLAEDTGLIEEIGRWVLVEACRQMALWAEQGIYLRVAINLSALQLRQSELPGDVEALLKAHDISAHLVTFEITETVAMADASQTDQAFRRLKAIGIQLSIDDFGTGYSSLSYLHRLPVHQLKIDRSFVADLCGSADTLVVVDAIIRLAHALRLEVVAEGVETEAQRETLLALGCDKLQGFHFARPMPADALTTWLRRRDAADSQQAKSQTLSNAPG